MSYKTYEVRVYKNGTREWFLNDKRHREDGPAVEYTNGHREWWVNGKHHREDGPAVEWSNGHREWWVNGEKLTEEEHARRTQPVQELTVAEISERLGYEVKVVK